MRFSERLRYAALCTTLCVGGVSAARAAPLGDAGPETVKGMRADAAQGPAFLTSGGGGGVGQGKSYKRDDTFNRWSE